MAEPQAFDASDPEQVKGRKAKSKRTKQALENDVRTVLSTVEGQRFVWRILAECGIESDPFNSNALWMAKAVGAQGIGRFIKILIAEACPEKFLEMQLLAAKEDSNG